MSVESDENWRLFSVKRILLFILCALMLLGASASASNSYLIHDIDTRKLFESELWDWQYDALGYMYNEVYARHGYHFAPGGKYYNAKEWYHECDPEISNEEIVSLLNPIEAENVKAIQKVRSDMREQNTSNPGGRPLELIVYEPDIPGLFSSFEKIRLPRNLKLRVFSGPGEDYFRAAKGKAMASTNGDIYACGWENGWLMITYWLSGDAVRVGYVPRSEIREDVDLPQLAFEYTMASVTKACELTDDPSTVKQTLLSLAEGDEVTYLGSFINQNAAWAYVETYLDNKPVRGFVPSECIMGLSVDETE